MTDIVITPASGNIQFYNTTNTTIIGSIYTTSANNLVISAQGGVTYGNTSADVNIGTGASTVNIVYPISGAIRAASSYTLTLGGSGSFVGFGSNVTSGIVSTVGTAALTFSNATSNWIQWNNAGVAAPSFTTRSAGTKLLLWPSITASSADYSIGIENNTLWFGVPTNSNQFKWYNGTTASMTLTGAGSLGIGTLTPNANIEISGSSPKLWISETTGTDLVELFLKQSGGSGEGLKLTYDSATGHSYLNSVYSAGGLYFQTASTSKMIISSSGMTTINHGVGVASLTDGFGLVINGNYINGQYSHRLRKWDDGGGVPLFVQYTAGTAGTWSNLAKFGPATGDAAFFRTYGYAQFDASARAPIFYDSDDTISRWTGDGLIMRGSSPTIYFRDTDQNCAMLHNNSNLLYILRGGNDTESWAQVNSQWPVTVNLTNNDCTIGGNLAAIGNITAYASDRRLKENIKEIPKAIEKIKQIRGVTFDWNEFSEQQGFIPDRKYDDVGVIAQEIQEVLPNVVTLAPFDTWRPDPGVNYSDKELTEKSGTSKSGDNFLTVQYEKIVPLLIQAIKEQQEQIEELKHRLDQNK